MAAGGDGTTSPLIYLRDGAAHAGTWVYCSCALLYPGLYTLDGWVDRYAPQPVKLGFLHQGRLISIGAVTWDAAIAGYIWWPSWVFDRM